MRAKCLRSMKLFSVIILSLFVFVACNKTASKGKVEKKEVNHHKQMESHKNKKEEVREDIIVLEGHLLFNESGLKDVFELLTPYEKEIFNKLNAWLLKEESKKEDKKESKKGLQEGDMALLAKKASSLKKVTFWMTRDGVLKIEFDGLNLIDVLETAKGVFTEEIQRRGKLSFIALGEKKETAVLAKGDKTWLVRGIRLKNIMKDQGFKKAKNLVHYKKVLGKKSAFFIAFDYQSFELPVPPNPLFKELKGGFFEYSYENKTITLQLSGDLGSQKEQVMALLKKQHQHSLTQVPSIIEAFEDMTLDDNTDFLLANSELFEQIIKNTFKNFDVKSENEYLKMKTEITPITKKQMVLTNMALIATFVAVAIPAFQNFQKHSK